MGGWVSGWKVPEQDEFGPKGVHGLVDFAPDLAVLGRGERGVNGDVDKKRPAAGGSGAGVREDVGGVHGDELEGGGTVGGEDFLGLELGGWVERRGRRRGKRRRDESIPINQSTHQPRHPPTSVPFPWCKSTSTTVTRDKPHFSTA